VAHLFGGSVVQSWLVVAVGATEPREGMGMSGYNGPVDMILSAEECRQIGIALRAYVPADGSAPFDAWLLAERVAQAIEDAAYHAELAPE